MSKKTKVGRVAYRVEGTMWCVYYAPLDTMEGAIMLGSIAMRLAARPERKQEFMEVMQAAFSDLSEELWGVRATFPDAPEAAPEHERAGHS